MAFSDPGKGRIIEQGEGLVKVTLAEACKAGDILGYSSGWKRALATVGTAIQGRLVAELVDGVREADSHEFTWDASHLSSGIYFIFFRSDQFNAVEKMILPK